MTNAEDPGLREVFEGIRRAPIRLICSPMSKAVNHGGLLRIADAFRLELVSFEPEPDGAVDFAGSRGTLTTQPYEWRSADDAIDEAKSIGYSTYALSLSMNAIALEDCEWQFPCALVLGSERSGIPEETLMKCDSTLAIPLYGLITSLNVATAAGIVVHHAIQAYRAIDTDFAPVRSASRRLVGAPPIDYRGDHSV